MTTFKSLCTAGITALALFTGAATPTTAQEALVNFEAGESPFDRSNALCAANPNLGCVKLGEGSNVLIRDMIKIFNKRGFNISFARVQKLNGWDESVTEDTPVEANKEFIVFNLG